MAAKSTSSKRNIHTVEIRAANRNCRQLSFTPSTVAVKWSMTRICMVKHTAQARISRSPGASVKLPLMHSRYRAITDSTTAIQVGRLTFRLKNRPNTGTSTTYRAVRKAGLAGVGAGHHARLLEVGGDGQSRTAAQAAHPQLPVGGLFSRRGRGRACPSFILSLMRMTTSRASTAIK